MAAVDCVVLASAVFSVVVGVPVPVDDASTSAGNCTTSVATTHAADHLHESGVHLAAWNFDYVSGPLIISLFVLLTGLVKIVFHHIHFLSSTIPESCILIVIGTGVGALMEYTTDAFDDFRLESRPFMLFLLPPIVLEAAYSLNNRAFGDNFGTILLYAVVGTVINFLIIGFSLWGLAVGNLLGPDTADIKMIECLLFGSIIVAVDPVAVLAIFQEIHVNATLYFLVFGESLLNDAVTIVLSNMMKAFSESADIQAEEIVIGIISFFTISLGGLSVGLLFGVLTALITRMTSRVRVVEPLAILITAYLSYLCAELVHWSGIISMIGCGIVQAQYALHNISKKSNITVVYFMKMLSNTCESVIFLFLGLELVRTNHEWETGFVLWSLLLCLVARMIGVFGLTFFVNLRNKHKPIKAKEQFIMWYGGLRGAICFAVCTTIPDTMKFKSLFLTTTYVIILFTVFFQGITIRPVVKYCHISKQKEGGGEPLLVSLQDQITDNTLSLVEILIGQRGQNYVRTWVYDFNDKYLKPLLQRQPHTQQEKFLELYKEAAVEYYETYILNGAMGSMYKNQKEAKELQAKMEEALVLDIKRELGSTGKPSNATESKDVSNGDLRRILSMSTMWLYDRNLTRDDDATGDAQAVRAAVRRYRSRQRLASFTQPESHCTSTDDEYESTNAVALHHTTSVISLTEADRRMIRPSLGGAGRRPTGRKPTGSRAARRSRSFQDPAERRPVVATGGETPPPPPPPPPPTTTMPPVARRYSSRTRSASGASGGLPRPLSTLGEEELASAADEQKKTANGSVVVNLESVDAGYVNPAMSTTGRGEVVDGGAFDEATFGEYVDQLDPTTWM